MDLPVLDSSALSEVGPVREDNQDSVRLPDDALSAQKGFLYALADGMGGYAHGALASRLALETLYRVFYEHGAAPGQNSLRQGVENANFEVFKTAQQLEAGRMGTTLTAGFIDGSTLFLAHVGDSRAYLVRGTKGVCLTNDHTTVGDLVRARVIGPDKVRSHPHRSVLTRSVGLSMFVKPDLGQVRLQEDDRLVLCSDGVWSAIEDEDVARLAVRAADAQKLSRALIDLALENESDDNVSVVSIFVHRLPHRPLNSNPLLGESWLAALRRLFPPLRAGNNQLQ
jgi:serine/threonine protein phosphatase PrpC